MEGILIAIQGVVVYYVSSVIDIKITNYKLNNGKLKEKKL